MSIRSAATTALQALRRLPPDDAVVAAVRELERALHIPRAERTYDPQPNRWGYRQGQPLRVKDGRLAGRTVEFARACSSTQIYVRHNGGRFAVQTKHVEPA